MGQVPSIKIIAIFIVMFCLGLKLFYRDLVAILYLTEVRAMSLIWFNNTVHIYSQEAMQMLFIQVY